MLSSGRIIDYGPLNSIAKQTCSIYEVKDARQLDIFSRGCLMHYNLFMAGIA